MEARLSDTGLTRDKTAIRLHPADNVVVAVRRLPAGTVLPGGVTTREPVPFGHKVATAAIAPGNAVRKYGQVIGVATQPIFAGAHVHVHNLVMSEQRADAEVPDFWRRNEEPRTFRGYRRKDGRAGVRNYIGVLTSVNCSATVARHIAEAAEKTGLLDGFDNVHGIVPITHASGCGMAGAGEGFDLLRRTLWGTAASAARFCRSSV
jgi:altronate hydrolase